MHNFSLWRQFLVSWPSSGHLYKTQNRVQTQSKYYFWNMGFHKAYKIFGNNFKLMSSLWLKSQVDLHHAHLYTPIFQYILKTNLHFLTRYVLITSYAVLKNYSSTQKNIYEKNQGYYVNIFFPPSAILYIYLFIYNNV